MRPVMKNILGLLEGRLHLWAEPKKWFLSFDQVITANLNRQWAKAKTIIKDQHLINDMEWLIEKEFVIESPYEFDLSNISSKKYLDYFLYVGEINMEIDLKTLPEKLKKLSSNERQIELLKVLDFYKRSGSEVGRANSIALNKRGIKNIPITVCYSEYKKAGVTEQTDVLNIAINSVSFPDDSVPWDDLVEFKNDPETKLKFIRLKRWAKKVAEQNLDHKEIQEEINDLLFEYNLHMDHFKFKKKQTTFQNLLVTTGTVAENLLKLKFGKIASGVFSIKTSKMELLDEERKAPGNELAYLSSVGGRYES